MRVVVTGASGNVGREVVAALLAAGHEVRPVVRSASPSEWPAGVEVVVGDLNEPSSLQSAWSGAQAAFILPGYPPNCSCAVRRRRDSGDRSVCSSAAPRLDESVVHPTVEKLTGRPPRTFREWADGHAAAFAG